MNYFFSVKVFDQLENLNSSYSTVCLTKDYTVVGTFNSNILVWNNSDIKVRMKNRERMKRMEIYTLKCNVYYDTLEGKKKKKKKKKKGKKKKKKKD